MTNTPAEQRRLVKETVRETLLQLGVNVEEPEEVLAFQRDLHHLRKWRLTMEALEGRSAWMVIATLITGVLAAFWIGFQTMLGRPLP